MKGAKGTLLGIAVSTAAFVYATGREAAAQDSATLVTPAASVCLENSDTVELVSYPRRRYYYRSYGRRYFGSPYSYRYYDYGPRYYRPRYYRPYGYYGFYPRYYSYYYPGYYGPYYYGSYPYGYYPGFGIGFSFRF